MQYCFKKLCYIRNFLLYSKHLTPLAPGHEMNLGHMWQISVQTIPCHPPHLSSMSPPPSEPKAGLNGVPSSPWAKLDQDQGLPLLSQWNPSSGLTIFLLLHIHWLLTISGENNPMRVRSTKIPWPPAFPGPSAPLNPFPHPWSTPSPILLSSGSQLLTLCSSPVFKAHLSFSHHDNLCILPWEHSGSNNSKLLNLIPRWVSPPGLCFCTEKAFFSSRSPCLWFTFTPLLRLGSDTASSSPKLS